MNNLTINTILLIISAVLPTILIFFYVNLKDKHKESLITLLSLFFFGALSSLGVLAVSYILNITFPFLVKDIQSMNMIQLGIKTFVEIALIEELFKWLIVYFFGYKNREFDETYDIIIYSIVVSLGFATLENILYVLQDNTFKTAVFRALTSVPGHVAFGTFMGYFLCISKIYRIKSNKKEINNLLKAIIVPTILHGIYDFCVMSNLKSFLYFFVIYIIVLFIIAFLRLKEIYELNVQIIKLDKICPKSRIKYKGLLCPKCNKRHE